MADPFYIEVNCQQKNHEGERICGDVFLSRRIREEGRTIAVLSDGLGSGVKANLLATLTATMALNFTEEHKDFRKIAEIILDTLPVCSERQISYATFTIVDIEDDGNVSIAEYDNPSTLVFRAKAALDIEWETIKWSSGKHAGREMRICNFKAQKEDRIIFCSDGIIQSGLGSKQYPFGWGLDSLKSFSEDQLKRDLDLSATKLASLVIKAAYINDTYYAKDDSSCAVIYFREPRKLLLCSGPPFEDENDKKLARRFDAFDGKRIISGATTGDIIARELDREIEDSFEFPDPELPPMSFMEGADLITEGILTLGKVSEILRNYSNDVRLGKGPADSIVKLFLESDYIEMIIGTRINDAHQDPNLPVELEIRRTVAKRIGRILEDKYLKEVKIDFL